MTSSWVKNLRIAAQNIGWLAFTAAARAAAFGDVEADREAAAAVGETAPVADGACKGRAVGAV